MGNKKPYEVKQTKNYDVCICGVYLPKGAVYLMLPERNVNGILCRKTYVWVENLQMAKRQRHFNVLMLRMNDKWPMKRYVDGEGGYAKLLKDFIMQLPDDQLKTKKGFPNRDMAKLLPKEKHRDYHVPTKGYKRYLSKHTDD